MQTHLLISSNKTSAVLSKLGALGLLTNSTNRELRGAIENTSTTAAIWQKDIGRMSGGKEAGYTRKESGVREGRVAVLAREE